MTEISYFTGLEREVKNVELPNPYEEALKRVKRGEWWWELIPTVSTYRVIKEGVKSPQDVLDVATDVVSILPVGGLLARGTKLAQVIPKVMKVGTAGLIGGSLIATATTPQVAKAETTETEHTSTTASEEEKQVNEEKEPKAEPHGLHEFISKYWIYFILAIIACATVALVIWVGGES